MTIFVCFPNHTFLVVNMYFVSYGGYKSKRNNATSGVPQGCNLGPLLFLLFIIDFVTCIVAEVLLYAGDLKIYLSVESVNDCETLQQQLSALQIWCKRNKLDLNVSKCKIMTMTRKETYIMYDYKLSSRSLQRVNVNTFRDLGVAFDDQLSFCLPIE